MKLTSLELCAGGGGQALGLEQAGVSHVALVELDKNACKTLLLNRPKWNVVNADLREFDASPYKGVDILAAGLPCPPFSIAGKQLGARDERNLFPEALRIVKQTRPRAVMIENVRGILDAVFEDFRTAFKKQIAALGYEAEWRLFNASEFGVPQLRPRVVFYALDRSAAAAYRPPLPGFAMPPTVGEVLGDLMAAEAWKGAKLWARRANEIAPTIVGGSHKHGGPDLGPTRARLAWASLGVDGKGIADKAPTRDFVGMPRLTVRMVARLQGFPDDWQFAGGKTTAYKQVGNAFPPPVARAIASTIGEALAESASKLEHASTA